MKPFIAFCLLVLVSVLPVYAAEINPTSAGKSQAASNTPPEPLAIGDIKLAWEISKSETADKKNSVIIFIRRFNCVTVPEKYISKNLKFAIVEKGEISDIKDPSVLNYQDEIPADRSVFIWKNGISLPKTVKAEYFAGYFEKFTAPAGIRIICNEILCLQFSNKYAAIKPTKAEMNHISWDKLTSKEKVAWGKTRGKTVKIILQEMMRKGESVPSEATETEAAKILKTFASTMDYEWAYWNWIPPKKQTRAK